MAKPKSPLLSLGARGTIAGTLTYQRRGREHLVRAKPVPSDPYSLAQAYQRWDYRDYAYQWTLLSDSEKQVYRTKASKYHITGFSQWMREKLKTLPDLALRCYLDEKGGAVAHDSSPYQTHGTIFGATPASGLIDGAQYFTLNDYVKFIAPQLNFTSGDFSIILRVFLDSLTIKPVFFTRATWNTDGYYLAIEAPSRLLFRTFQLAAQQVTKSANGAITIGSWLTLGMSRDGASVRLYKNGEDITVAPGVHLDPATSIQPAYLGIWQDEVSSTLDGRADHLIIFNRALSATEHKRHSERRYPA